MNRLFLFVLVTLLLLGGCGESTTVLGKSDSREDAERDNSQDVDDTSGDSQKAPEEQEEQEDPEEQEEQENPEDPQEPAPQEPVEVTSPLLPYQWYIHNDLGTESNAFTNSSEGNGGNHINVLQAHELATGTGVIVNVLDSDLELGHEDLTTSQINSYDYLELDTDPQPIGTGGSHGTSVAGIIGMKKDNRLGGIGVAPGVTIIGHAYIARATMSTSDYAKAYGVPFDSSGDHVASEIAQVFNNSNGIISDDFEDSNEPWVQITWQMLDAGVRLGRQGKGYIYVKSSGNNFFVYVYYTDGTYQLKECSTQPLGCFNSSTDYGQAHPARIVVAATNAKGKKSSYSTIGSSLWIAAPGGEYGYDRSNPDGGKLINGYHPAIVTTDYQGCDKGYSKGASETRNSFEYNQTQPHELNPDCNYTSIFNGTSSAAPMVSGVAALMLEVNPDLAWRDVKHILATTATQIDATNSNEEIDGVMVKNGWTTNGAGHKFHSWYGFGQVDAYEAVKAAQTYTANNLGTFRRVDISADNLEYVIPDYDSNTNTPGHARITVNVSDTMTVMSARLTLSLCRNISTNPMRAIDYTIHLTSPAGTTSVLKSSYDENDGEGHGYCSLYNAAILSNAFYGESANGTWSIDIYDLKRYRTAKLTDYTLTVFGN